MGVAQRVSIVFLLLVLIKALGPLSLVVIQILLQVGQLGEHFDDGCEGWLHDEVDKSDLALGDVCRLSIVELAHIEAELFLHITLSEELDEEQVAPELA